MIKQWKLSLWGQAQDKGTCNHHCCSAKLDNKDKKTRKRKVIKIEKEAQKKPKNLFANDVSAINRKYNLDQLLELIIRV